jgi:hypothetical protein
MRVARRAESTSKDMQICTGKSSHADPSWFAFVHFLLLVLRAEGCFLTCSRLDKHNLQCKKRETLLVAGRLLWKFADAGVLMKNVLHGSLRFKFAALVLCAQWKSMINTSNLFGT